MKCFFPFSLALLSITLAIQATNASPREEADAHLALAKSLHATNAPRVVALDYETARQLALKEGKPLITRVGGIDCSPCCEQMHGEVVVGERKELFGDSRARVVLSVPSNGQLWYATEWNRVPTATEAHQAIARAKSTCVGNSCAGPATCAAGGNCADCPACQPSGVSGAFGSNYSAVPNSSFGSSCAGGSCSGGSCGTSTSRGLFRR